MCRSTYLPAACFLLAASLSPAAVLFDVTFTNVSTTPSLSFPRFGPQTIASTPLEANQDTTGFKISGTASARNNANGACLNCQMTVSAGGAISSLGLGPLPTVPVAWLFRVDEVSTTGIGDGSSNTLQFNTTLPPTRIRQQQNGGISDGSSNTILIGEATPTDPRDFIYRLIMTYTTPASIGDGSSNTITFGETTEQQIAAGNGYFGDDIIGLGSFPLLRRTGDFTLALQLQFTEIAVNHGVTLTIPENSIDVNPPSGVPEPAAAALAAAGLIWIGIKHRYHLKSVRQIKRQLT